eukprot:scaffold74186_cov71-Phaeocystis_antarctica.AAC.3
MRRGASNSPMRARAHASGRKEMGGAWCSPQPPPLRPPQPPHPLCTRAAPAVAPASAGASRLRCRGRGNRAAVPPDEGCGGVQSVKCRGVRSGRV